MTETEKKALALLNEACLGRTTILYDTDASREDCIEMEALCRAIEQHEAFRQEVSAMLIDEYGEEFCRDHSRFARFIIAKPDPLVEALKKAGLSELAIEQIRAAIQDSGGKIVWEGK